MASFLSSIIKRLIRLGKVTLPGDDTGQFPVQQITYMNKAANAVMWFPYGFHANVPPERLALLFSILGNAEARVAFPGSPEDRPTLETGEVVIFHPPSGSKIHFKTSGDIELVTTTKVKVDAPVAEFTGDVDITGDLDVTGDTALGAAVTSNGKDISDTHSHVGSPTAPDGAISNTGVPV